MASNCGEPLSVTVPAQQHNVPTLAYRIIASYPHDATAFTEGLAYDRGHLYESTGLVGSSSVREVEIVTGRVELLEFLPAPAFGEGLSRVGDDWYQLTWQNHYAVIYNASLKPVGKWVYGGEGWGLAYDHRRSRLFLSDGSDVLRFYAGATPALAGELHVRDGPNPVRALNELEVVGDLIFANVWHSNEIAVIDGNDGHVRAWVDLSELRAQLVVPAGWPAREAVLNGIAYNPESGHFYVTGKLWPRLFEIELLKPTGVAAR